MNRRSLFSGLALMLAALCTPQALAVPDVAPDPSPQVAYTEIDRTVLLDGTTVALLVPTETHFNSVYQHPDQDYPGGCLQDYPGGCLPKRVAYPDYYAPVLETAIFSGYNGDTTGGLRLPVFQSQAPGYPDTFADKCDTDSSDGVAGVWSWGGVRADQVASFIWWPENVLNLPRHDRGDEQAFLVTWPVEVINMLRDVLNLPARNHRPNEAAV